jgi:hypothetical protein
MKTLLLAAFTAVAVACPLAVASGGDSASAETGSAKSPKPSVRKGMTADEVVAVIGKPKEIKPVVTEVGTGESWIYRRVAKRVTNQVAPTVEKVPMWGGPGVNVANGEVIDVNVPFQRLERITIYQMTALLFVDGKVTASKQWIEQERNFY